MAKSLAPSILMSLLPLIISSIPLDSATHGVPPAILETFHPSSIQKSFASFSGAIPDPGSRSNSDSGGSRTSGSKEGTVLETPIIKLKRRAGESREYNKQKQKPSYEPEMEVECSQTMYMSPYHLPVQFSLNASIYSRMEKVCKWSFIGSEPCIPKLTCTFNKNPRECYQEYMEIVDGGEGYMKACGNETTQQVVNMSATLGMRDLYIHYKVLRPPKRPLSGLIFNCTMVCSKRLEGTPLKKSFQPKLNPKCFCGTKPNEERIVGGEGAKKFEYPWLVALVETNTRQPFCGGSILNTRFILTAAHCIQGKFMDYRNLQVVVNGHEFDQSFSQTTNFGPPMPPKTYPLRVLERLDTLNRSRRYNLEEIIIHPLYVVETNDFDVALLKLQEDIYLSPKPRSVIESESMDAYLQQPRAVCLPDLGSYSRTYSNKKAIVAGWGLPSADAQATMLTLQKLEVKVFSPQVCKDLYAHRVNRRMMCAGHREGGRDSCSGDSGGPLVVQEKPKVYTQVGTVSWGEGCGEPDHPGVYFRITEGVQWINYHSNFNGARDEDETDIGGTWCITPP